MPTLYIDNKPYEVSSGKNLLEVCLTLGVDLPYFCWHPALGSVGACRQCAVKIFKDENDKKGRLIMSCMEPVTNNQRISVVDEEAHEFRENVIGWLMTNHPHDCAVCDEGGSCHLQDMTVMTGHSYRKFNYKKRTYTNQNLGPFINHEMNRCIQCYRCVRFYKDYAGGRDLDAFASRNQVYFGRAEDGVLENEFSGNLAEVCPTGVFTDKTLKAHYTRKWDLTTAPSICQHCSLGCNIIAGERYGSIRMISNRYNGEVNGYFICDRGRFGYEFVNAKDRIRTPLVHGKTVTGGEVMKKVLESVRQSRFIGIGSPRASLESNFALKELVGKDNFFLGLSDVDHELTELALQILKELRPSTMKEVEGADAIFILGDDVTNTAPMMALAIRQSVRNQPNELAGKANIPVWHDAAVREWTQEEKGPLYIADVQASKLDDVATNRFTGAPDDVARLGYAVAHALDSSAPAVTNISDIQKKLVQEIAKDLLNAKRPVIVTGTSSGNEQVVKAAANVAAALRKKNMNAGIVITLPECNSLGLAMIGGRRLKDAFNIMEQGQSDTAIVLENDLYRRGKREEVDGFISQCKEVIVVDHTNSPTAQKAHILIPAGTFTDSDGTIVNNEGRAQRFFQVHESSDVMKESWRWLAAIGTLAGKGRGCEWENFEAITNAIGLDEPLLAGVKDVTPSSDFRVEGQRIPRESHRYSGRTSMHAHVAVSETKPPEDPDSSLSYTMEGYRGQPPSSMIPYYWTPGWNSVQSVNKYQVEVGAALRGGDPGVRLFTPDSNSHFRYFQQVPDAFHPKGDRLWAVWIHHIFGSEELSTHAASVSERIPKPYVMICTTDAAAYHLEENQLITIEMNGQSYKLPVKISSSLAMGIAGLPFGFVGGPYSELPGWATIKQ